MPMSLNVESRRGNIPLQLRGWPRFTNHAELTARIVIGLLFALTVAAVLVDAALMLGAGDIISTYPEMFSSP
jgi:hypothetical protein